MSIPRRFLQFAFFSSFLLGAVESEAALRGVDSPAAFQAAINSAAEGDIIELAAGTYSAPAGGFTLFNPTTGFTIRAASGAAVTLTGNGGTDILRFTNAPKPVIFQGLTFASGVSTTNFIGGAMTMDHIQAIFISCNFSGNQTNGSLTGGGLFINQATVSFQACNWTGNTSPNYGAGVSILNSQVYITGSTFTGNRCDLPNHKQNSAGAAVFVAASTDGAPTPFTRSTVRISNCTFDGNRAGYVGGAIYTLGQYQAPLDVPAVNLVVSNSLFTNNAAIKDPSVTFPNPSAGGAVHVEDQTTAAFVNCRFLNNQAKQGGAISGYRTATDFQNCIFRDNTAVGNSAGEAVGGAIIALSADNSDSSTFGGTVNRSSVVLTMTDCLIAGDGTTVNARDAGGIFVGGDINAQYGTGGIRQDPTVNNRGTAVLTRVVFDKLVTAATGSIPGTGGAIETDFSLLTMDSSLVTNCSTSDNGGAAEFVRDSVCNITNTTFAANRAGSLGGALLAFGGTLNLNGDRFVDNQSASGNGAAITSAPIPEAPGYYPASQDVTGLVQQCIFSNNTGGVTIYDGDRATAPFNRLQYSLNRIFPADGTAFRSDNVGQKSVAELNATTIAPSGVVKAPSANTGLTAAATVGSILLVPAQSSGSGGPGEAVPVQPFVAYAASGGTAAIDGISQKNNAGIAGPTTDGIHTLAVGGQTFATTTRAIVAGNLATRLPVGTGQNVLIGGFIIKGSTDKRVIIRAIGPSLTSFFGAAALQDPTLELHDGGGATIARNDNWRTTQVNSLLSSDQAVEIAGTGIPPTNDAESAIIATLKPGAYTAIVSGANSTTGIGLVEVYDLDAAPVSTLGNLATRGFVAGGNDVMIGGVIIVGGPGPTNFVVRGIGPSLSAFGITNPLSDPAIEVHDANGATIASNDNWQSGPDAAAITAANLQPSSPAESAVLLQSPPRGAYTAILQGKTGPGVGVVEVYVF